ncbi:putative reverse transcriptase domain-containing protein [Tanacetum coccineum]
MDLMSRVYKPYLDKFIDDISICSSRNEEHEEHLRLILGLLKNKELYYNDAKGEGDSLRLPTTESLLEELLDTRPRIRRNSVSFKIWEHCLDSIKHTMFTNHKGLQYILDQMELNVRPRRSFKKGSVKDENLHGMDKESETRLDRTLCIRSRSWFPHFRDLRELIMHGSHKSDYFIYPGSGKIYHNLKKWYRWSNKETDIATNVSKCSTCLKMKDDYQKPSGLLV